MTRRCLGWFEPKHAPKILGEVFPFDDDSITDGVCDECLLLSEKSDAEQKLDGKEK
jgi:hypothetical protein